MVLADDAARDARSAPCATALVVAGHERDLHAVAVHVVDHLRDVGAVVEDVEHAVVAEHVLALRGSRRAASGEMYCVHTSMIGSLAMPLTLAAGPARAGR